MITKDASKSLLGLGILLLFFSSLWAQEHNKLDSLRLILSTAETAKDSAKTHYSIANSLSKKGEFELAIEECRYAINSLEKADFDSLYVKSYEKLLANAFHASVPIKDFLLLADTVAKHAEQAQDMDALLQVFLMKGILLDELGQDEKALEAFNKAIALMPNVKDKTSVVPIYNALGNLLKDNNQIDKAIGYYKKALYIADTAYWELGKSVILNNLASAYVEAERYDEAEPFYKESIAIKKSINNKTNLSVSFCHLASLYEKTGKWDLAYQYVYEGLDLAKTLNYYNGTAICLIVLSDIHAGQNRVSERIQVLEEALVLSITKHGDYSEGGLEVYESLHQAYKDKGDFNKAYSALESYTKITDSLIRKRNDENLEELEIQFQQKEVEMGNALLVEQQQQAELKLNQRKIVNYTIIFFMLFLGFISIVYVRQKVISNRQLDLLVKEKTKALQETVQELEQANEELTQFAYITSHDLKEPLRNINGFTTLLERKLGVQLEEKDKLLIENIKRSTHQMNRLIEDVMQFSLVAHKELHYEQVQLSNIIDDVRNNLNEQIKEKGAKITLQEDTYFWSSHTHLLLILTNLCQNGIHYNESAQPEILVKPIQKDNGWLIEVCDNGIGIAPEFQEQIFIMFKRLHSRSRYEGTGLGLPITKRLVEQLGGKISLQSKQAEGSTFSVFLPQLQAQANVKDKAFLA